MIGFYDYTVVLTLLSIMSSVIGMTRAMQGHFRMAIFLLALAGFFDTFDGRVARTKKNRTDDEKLYGIQLDSLADIVSFGVYPTMIAYLMGMREVYDVAILCLYVVCGVIRLSFFNVLATNKFYHPTDEESTYHGLPITSIAGVMPLTFLLSFTMSEAKFIILLRVLMLVISVLFVLDFTIKKPKLWQVIVMILIACAAAVIILLFSKYRLPHRQKPEEPWVEATSELEYDLVAEAEWKAY